MARAQMNDGRSQRGSDCFLWRITVIILVDIIAFYALSTAVAYLTNVWKLSFTHASSIINIWMGITSILPLFFLFVGDVFNGHYWILVFSNITSFVGLGLLTLSTPPVLSDSTGTCSEYKPECMGHTQKLLFYIALGLTALGTSSRSFRIDALVSDNIRSKQNLEIDETANDMFNSCAVEYGKNMVGMFFGFLLGFIKPWSFIFGVPAGFSLVATVFFLRGSYSDKGIFDNSERSPITIMTNVLVASVSKMFRCLLRLPNHTNNSGSPRSLDEGAVIPPDIPEQDQEGYAWTRCMGSEVKDTKACLLMLPLMLTFIFCGIVSSVGSTYFLEQATHTNRKVWFTKMPLTTLVFYQQIVKGLFLSLYAGYYDDSTKNEPENHEPLNAAPISMIVSVICCIVAAKLESRRLNVVKKHNLFDMPDQRVPMSVLWLVPQFIILGAVDDLFEASATVLFTRMLPASMKKFAGCFTKLVYGLGVVSNPLLVYVIGQVSERGGKTSWFGYTLNHSRLDNYYWTLAALGAGNLVLFGFVSTFYRRDWWRYFQMRLVSILRRFLSF